MSNEHLTRWKRPWPLCASAFLAVAVAGAGCAPVPPPEPETLAPDLPTREPVVRVALVEDRAAEIGHRGGARFVDVATDRVVHEATTSGVWEVRRRGAGIELSSTAGDAPLRFESGARIEPLEGARLQTDDRAYRGFLMIRPDADTESGLRVINHVPMEDYLLGVVPREIGAVGVDLFEAARAQAVAARTYAISRLGRRDAAGFDVYATVQDQVYGGMRDEHPPVSRAVEGTTGEILTYAGFPIEAYYHSTCAGVTAAIEEVWDAAPRPYLRSVVDVDPATGQSYDHFSSRYRWTERWTREEMEAILAETLRDSLDLGPGGVGELLDIEVLDRTRSHRIRDMRIVTSAGTVHAGGDGVRWILMPEPGRILNSARFEVTLSRDAQNRIREVIIDGMGWGHGIGMCQVGAMGRARAGQDYREILSVYYQDTRLVDLYDR